MKKRRLVGISPWIIIGAVAVLAPIFLFMTQQTLDRQQSYTTRLLVDRGDALIRSFEAGVRTGLGLEWEHFQLQKLLIETAQQPGIDYLAVTDENGVILADSDPSQLGEIYGTDLDLQRIAASDQLQWRRTPNPVGADTFEIYRQFKPARGEDWDFQDRIRPEAARRPDRSGTAVSPARMVIFVGLDMGPLETARKEDYWHAVMMAMILLLIGLSGVISLLLAQGYRSARTSLSRVRAFSDSLVKNMPMGLIAINEIGQIVACNQSAESILQQAAVDVMGRGASEILPQDCRQLIDSLGPDKRIIAGEVDCPFAGGRKIPLEVIAAALDEDGNAGGVILLLRDITEIRHLKKEIARSQHLASLGNLAAGVAHEIRNPLSSIKGFATHFRERFRNSPKDENTAGIMIQEVDRLDRVIGQLLDYARPLTMHLQEIQIQTIIQHALRMTETQARNKGISLQADLPPEIPAVGIDPDRMKQVFLNLFLNALGAMETGGVLTVTLKASANGRIRIEVRDTGVGIAPQNLDRIFDPYFTTKPSGAGLGLAIVQKIIDAHDAEIQIASTPGRGTTVTIVLPAKYQAHGGE